MSPVSDFIPDSWKQWIFPGWAWQTWLVMSLLCLVAFVIDEAHHRELTHKAVQASKAPPDKTNNIAYAAILIVIVACASSVIWHKFKPNHDSSSAENSKPSSTPSSEMNQQNSTAQNQSSPPPISSKSQPTQNGKRLAGTLKKQAAATHSTLGTEDKASHSELSREKSNLQSTQECKTGTICNLQSLNFGTQTVNNGPPPPPTLAISFALDSGKSYLAMDSVKYTYQLQISVNTSSKVSFEVVCSAPIKAIDGRFHNLGTQLGKVEFIQGNSGFITLESPNTDPEHPYFITLVTDEPITVLDVKTYAPKQQQ